MMTMMTVSQACEALGVSRRTLYRLLADCAGAGAERHGRRLPTLIPADALDAMRAALAARRARERVGSAAGQAAIAAYNARRAKKTPRTAGRGPALESGGGTPARFAA